MAAPTPCRLGAQPDVKMDSICKVPQSISNVFSRFEGKKIMIWLLLEAGLALALLIFIVWWTLPRKSRRSG